MSRSEQDALLALFNSFRPSKRVTAFDQLADGKVLLEVMHSIDETHFKGGPKAHARSLSSGTDGQDNWVLRMNILKRLYRLLLSYPINTPNAPTLGVTSLPEPNFNAIARSPKSAEGSSGLVQICRFCVAVGAVGPANERVIAKIQALDEGAMVELMKCIEGVMDTLPRDQDDDKDEDISPPSSALREERDRLLQMNAELRAQCEQMTEQVASLSANIDATEETKDNDTEREATQSKDGGAESDALRANLARAEEGLSETEAALEKQTEIVAELTKTVEELRSTSLEVSQLRDQVEELRQVEDRLHKSENVIEKYKKKLEESAGLRRELRTLEEENSSMVDKNSDLEAELKKLGTSKALVDQYKVRIDALEKRTETQSSEIGQITAQLEEAQTSLGATESERDLLRDEVQVHQERIRELEAGPRSNLPDQSLDVELDADSEEPGQSKTDLKLRIKALERQLADTQSSDVTSERIEQLEQERADAEKRCERYQKDYLEASRDNQLSKAKLEEILAGRGGDSTQTALALRQQLDEVLAERDSLFKDKQAGEVAHEELVRQLVEAKANLGLVDKEQQSVIATAREEAREETRKMGERMNSLKDEVAGLRERDRLHLAEIKRLVSGGDPAVKDAQRSNDQVPLGSGDAAVDSQVSSLKAQLSEAKQNALAFDSRYRLEYQLMLSGWHDIGSRIVRDHVGVAGLRRPAVARPVATSWLGRQRKLQDDALFAR